MLVSASASALALASAAAAQSEPFPIEMAAASSVIVVTGTRDVYGAETISSGTRTDTPLVDIPQAITAISQRQIEDQAMRSIGDVLRWVPGASIGQGEGHRDQITLRGNNSTSDFFVDGLRDDIQYYRPLYNVQRIEVLRGPNAMIFGRGGGGGVINRVSKQPLFHRQLSGEASVDTFGAWYAAVDLNEPLAPGAAVRLNAVHEEFANHRDFYDGRMIAVNPALRFLPGPDTGIGLSYEYVNDERVVDRGLPSFAGRPLEGVRDTYFGVPVVNYMEFEGHVVRGAVEHRFTPSLTLISRLLYADYDKFYRNVFPSGTVTVDPETGARRVTVAAYQDAYQRDSLLSQTDLVWSAATGPLSHTLLAGIEWGRQDTGNQRVTGFFGPTATSLSVPLTDPMNIPAPEFRAGPGQRSTATEVNLLALYVQDQIEIGRLELIAGLRYDRFSLAATDLLTGVAAGRTENLLSPRLGLVYHPVPDVSLYASYARSYLPQAGDQFNSLDVATANLVPERFDNYEIGAKWKPRAGLLLSAAAYRLDRTNTRAPGPVPGTIVQTGAQRSRGIELEAVGELRRDLRISLGYALQDAEISETTSAAPAGRKAPLVPRHQLSAWARHDLTPEIGFGLGLHHQSSSFASISNAVVLPSFTRVDAALFFRLAAGVEGQINVENLLGETWYPTAHSDPNITPGAPRGARATVRFRF